MRLRFSKTFLLLALSIFSAACPAPCKISDADASAVYADAAPIVQALEKFRAEGRDYPAQLSELAPKYAAKIPAKFGNREFSYARKSASDYELRIAAANGGFYSESCTLSEVEDKWEDLQKSK